VEIAMRSSFNLLTIRGIDIRIHITFPLILLWSAFQYGFISSAGWVGAAIGVLITLLLFVLVVLHELGHSIAAQHFGIPVKQIVLLPIGGVAQLTQIPENPRMEFIIAIAGPLVNFLLAILILLGGLILGLDMSPSRMGALVANISAWSPRSILVYIFISNLFLGMFNLLPAFPMDGGRVLRAALATRMPYDRATATAVNIGQSLAWILGLMGFLQGNLMLILIAIFIYFGAGQEGQVVQFRKALQGLRVEHVYSRQTQCLDKGDTLHDAVRLTLSTIQSSFPVCDGEKLVGLLTQKNLLQSLDEHGSHTTLSSVALLDVDAVTLKDDLITVQRKLAEQETEALPVMDDGRLVGLITNKDIVEAYRIASSRMGHSRVARHLRW
jgi:Zn-dependent protease/CBS domain-containing protein